MRLLMIICYLLLVVFGVSFAALNAASVVVNFYFFIVSLPLSVLLIIVLAMGVVIGFILFLGKYWSLKREHHKIRGQLKLTEKEIKNLRSIPLQDQH